MKNADKIDVDKLRRLIRRYNRKEAALNVLKKIVYKIEKIFAIEGADLYPVMIIPESIETTAADEFDEKMLQQIWGKFPLSEYTDGFVIIKDKDGRTIQMLNPQIRQVYYSRQVNKPFLKLTTVPAECWVRVDIMCDQVIAGHPVEKSKVKENNNEKRL